MKRIYQLQLDFDEPVRHFADLNQLFAELNQAGHVFVHSASSDKYREMAEGCCIDAIQTPFYIETSISAEGVFVENKEFWIENYMLGEFSSPEQMPYIEMLLSEEISKQATRPPVH